MDTRLVFPEYIMDSDILAGIQTLLQSVRVTKKTYLLTSFITGISLTKKLRGNPPDI